MIIQKSKKVITFTDNEDSDEEGGNKVEENEFEKNYVLEEVLGQGAFGIVHKIKHKFSSDYYAAKVL